MVDWASAAKIPADGGTDAECAQSCTIYYTYEFGGEAGSAVGERRVEGACDEGCGGAGERGEGKGDHWGQQHESNGSE